MANRVVRIEGKVFVCVGRFTGVCIMCEACEACEPTMRGMRVRGVRHASQASQTCEACESCIRSFLMTSNQIKKTDKGVGVYFKGQNVESVLTSQESNIYHRPKPDEPTTYQRHLV